MGGRWDQLIWRRCSLNTFRPHNNHMRNYSPFRNEQPSHREVKNFPKVTQLVTGRAWILPRAHALQRRVNHCAELPLVDKVRSQQRSEGREELRLRDIWAPTFQADKEQGQRPQDRSMAGIFKDQHQGQCSGGKGSQQRVKGRIGGSICRWYLPRL